MWPATRTIQGSCAAAPGGIREETGTYPQDDHKLCVRHGLLDPGGSCRRVEVRGRRIHEHVGLARSSLFRRLRWEAAHVLLRGPKWPPIKEMHLLAPAVTKPPPAEGTLVVTAAVRAQTSGSRLRDMVTYDMTPGRTEP